MPYEDNDNYWGNIFSSPSDSDTSYDEDEANSYWGNIYGDNPLATHGLATNDWDPNVELANDNLFTSFMGNIGSMVGQGVLGAGEAITDVLETARNSFLEQYDSAGKDTSSGLMSGFDAGHKPVSTSPLSSSAGSGGMFDVMGDLRTPSPTEQLQGTPETTDEDMRQLRESQRQNSVLGVASNVFHDTRTQLQETGEVNRRTRTEGGSLVDELQASMGLKGFEGYDPVKMASAIWENKDEIGPVEFFKDSVGLVSDISAGMVGMGIEGTMMPGGLVAKAQTKAASLIGAGMTLDVFQDTYNENTQDPENSRMLALATAAVSAAVQGKVESMSLDGAFGKGVIGKMFKESAKNSRLRTAAVRSLMMAPTEMVEEGMQTVVDIAAKSVPEATENWGAAWNAALKQAGQELPDTLAGAALFGGVLGGTTGFFKLGVADIDARHADTPSREEDKIAASLEKGPTANEMPEVVVGAADLVSSIDDSAQELEELDKVSEPEPVIDPLRPYQPLPPPENLASKERKRWMDRERVKAKRSLAKIAKAAQVPSQAANNAIVDEVIAQEEDRAKLAQELNTSSVDMITEKIVASIDGAVEDRAQKVQSLADTWGQLSQMVAGAIVEFSGEDESAGVMPTAVQATKEEAIVVLAGQAAKLGITLPDELLQDPDSFDWGTWSASEAESARATASATLAPLSVAITDSIDVEPDSPLHLISSLLPEPPVASAAPPSDDVVQSQPTLLQSRQAKVVAEQKKHAAGEPAKLPGKAWYRPEVATMASGTMDMSLKELFTVGQDGLMPKNFPDRVLGILQAKYGHDVVPSLTALGKDFTAKVYQLSSTNDYPRLRQLVQSIQSTLSAQMIPDFTQYRASGFSPDVEATRGLTAGVAHTLSMENRPGPALNQEIAMGLNNAGLAIEAPVYQAFQSEEEAIELGPWAKTMLFNLWQTAPRDLSAKVHAALSSTEDIFSSTEHAQLGKEVIEHLTSQGLYKAATSRMAADPKFAEDWSRAMIGVGKGTMGPWSLKRALIDNGVDPDVADSTINVAHLMSKRWVNKTGKSVFEFWDRLGDKVRVMHYKKARAASGMAQALSEPEVEATAIATYNKFESVGKGLLRIWTNLSKGNAVTATLHEVVHMLHFSGLLHEMLEADGIAALNDLVGMEMWDHQGNAAVLNNDAYEKLTMGFEKFILMNKAPNDSVRAAWQTVKSFLVDSFHNWLLKTGKVSAIKPNLSELYHKLATDGATRGEWLGSSAYKTDKTSLKWKDMKVEAAQIKAFYSILNYNPDGTEIAYGAPGLAGAYESQLADNTGLPASGVITHETGDPSPLVGLRGPEDEGWWPDSGRTPTEEEWRDMVGLVNPDSNGTHSTQSLLEMEPQRQAMGEFAQDVAMSPPQDYDEDAETNTEVQKSVAQTAPMKSERGHDLMMEHYSNILFAQEKDVYAEGKKVNYFNMAEVKAMLENFSFKMMVWGLEFKHHPLRVAKRELISIPAGKIKSAVNSFASSVVKGLGELEKSYGNLAAPWENLFEEMGMPSMAMMINNGFAVAKRAEKIAEMPPDVYNVGTHERVRVPGAKSFNKIMLGFAKMAEAYWAENEVELPYRDDVEFMAALRRDFRLYLLALRQKEIEANVADDLAQWEREKAAWESSKVEETARAARESTSELKVEPQFGEEPARPKVPRITKETSVLADNILLMLEARYGKDISMFKVVSAELTQWENHMVLDKLLSVGMISEQEVADMTRKGRAHVPLYRVRAKLAKAGARNARIDGSLFSPLDYLKNDLSIAVEDPIDSMLRKAQAIEVLTFRQVAKNEIGKAILRDLKWWSDERMTIFADKIQITKKEYDEISNDKSNRWIALSQAKKTKRGPNGDMVADGVQYYKHVPLSADKVEEGMKHLVEVNKSRSRKKGAAGEKEIRDRIDHAVFAFYPEPGMAMYVMVADKELSDSFFYLNNPQALMATSIQQKMLDFIDNMPGAEEDSGGLNKLAYGAAKLLHTGYYGGNRFVKEWVIANANYVFQALFRDVFAGIPRSKHGLRLSDLPRAYVQSLAIMFPSLKEVDPDVAGSRFNFDVANDAEQGTSTFSGLAAMNSKGELSSDVLFELMRSRSKHNSVLAKLWNDVAQFAAKEGMNKSLAQLLHDAKNRENVRENLFYIAKSPFMALKSGLKIAAALNENTVRLAERSLTMKEDMSQWPQLMRYYDPAKAIGGKVLAGFNGSLHRRAWEKAKKRLAADPNAIIGEHELPVQFDSNARDYAQSHITINFAQKGMRTQNLNDVSMFAGAAIQDTYTSMLKVANWSKIRKVTAKLSGEGYVPLAQQARLDSEAAAWLWKGVMLVTIPSIIQAVAYSTGDDDDSIDWQNQSFFEKMAYHWIPIHKVPFSPFKKPLRIASGLGLATLIFRDAPMAAVLELTGVDKKAGAKWRDRFFEGTKLGLIYGPIEVAAKAGMELAGVNTDLNLLDKAEEAIGATVAAPELVNPMWEIFTDKDQFRNKAIKDSTVYDNRESSEVNSEKYNVLTNTLARKLNFTGMQPAQVQYMVKRYLPGGLRSIPYYSNKALEAATGEAGVPEDMMPSNSPLVGNMGSGFWPKLQATDPWGMGNEFVRDLLNTAKEATTKRNTYDEMLPSRQPLYKSQNPIIDDSVFNPLSKAAKAVLEADKVKRYQLKNGLITPLEASFRERAYTLLAHQAMSNLIQQLEGGVK